MMSQGLLETLLNVMLQLVKKKKKINRNYLMQYTAAKTDAKRCQVPCCSYFKKIYSFFDTSKLERCFLNTKREVKFPVANYVTI